MSGEKKMDHDDNRSSALTPETLALINTQTAATVQALVGSMMKDIIGPLMAQLQANTLTPEKFLELKKPYVDPRVEARDKRESAKTREEEKESLAQLAANRAGCPHSYQTGLGAIGLMRNNPDRQPRGICVLCQDIIHPREWVIGAPDPVTGKTIPYIRNEHKDYARVRVQAAQTP